MRFTLDVGIPASASEDENDDESEGIRPPGEYELGPGIERDGGSRFLLAESADEENPGYAARSCTRRNESRVYCP
jgi:hypothetical protein